MTSPELLDLDRDLPTTPEDVEALRRARRIAVSDPQGAVQALSDSLPPAARRPRRGTARGRPELRL